MSIISIPKALREKLGDNASESLVEMLNHYSRENRESIIELATRKYENRLTHELADLKADIKSELVVLREEMNQLKTEMTHMDHSIRSDLGTDISALRVEMHKNNATAIKWMFVFWIGQIAALIGILFAFFS